MGLDSLAFMEIQLAMQQDYGFRIPDEDAEEIHSVGEAIDYVNKRLGEEEESRWPRIPTTQSSSRPRCSSCGSG